MHTHTQPQVHTVIGGWLLLRAARPIAEGDELTTCHIGPGRFQHVASRRSQLQREVDRKCVRPASQPLVSLISRFFQLSASIIQPRVWLRLHALPSA